MSAHYCAWIARGSTRCSAILWAWAWAPRRSPLSHAGRPPPGPGPRPSPRGRHVLQAPLKVDTCVKRCAIVAIAADAADCSVSKPDRDTTPEPVEHGHGKYLRGSCCATDLCLTRYASRQRERRASPPTAPSGGCALSTAALSPVMFLMDTSQASLGSHARRRCIYCRCLTRLNSLPIVLISMIRLATRELLNSLLAERRGHVVQVVWEERRIGVESDLR